MFVKYFLDEINKLQFDSEPSYSYIHGKLDECLESLGHKGSDDFKLFKNLPGFQNWQTVSEIKSYLGILFFKIIVYFFNKKKLNWYSNAGNLRVKLYATFDRNFRCVVIGDIFDR